MPRPHVVPVKRLRVQAPRAARAELAQLLARVSRSGHSPGRGWDSRFALLLAEILALADL